MASLRTLPAVLSLVCVAASMGCGGSKKDAKNPSSAASTESSGGAAEVGKPAPDLSVETVNGKGKVSIGSLSGKVAIVDFWATWCAPCKQSFPKLEELSKQNSGKLEVVGIAVDDQVDGVADFAKKNGATFAVGWDSGHSIANRWKVETMPTTYVLDATGTVRFIHAGYHDDEAEKIAKEVAQLGEESGTKMTTGGKSEGKAEGKSEGKAEGKAEGKSEGGTASGGGDDAAEAPKPPPKKGGKGGKKPGKKPPPKKKPGAKSDAN